MDLNEQNPEKIIGSSDNGIVNAETPENVTKEKMTNKEKNNDSNVKSKKQTKQENETMKKIKKIIKPISLAMKIITWLIVIALLAILIMTVLSRKTDVFGHRIYLIVTGSMEPTIKMKDVVITKQTDDLKEGDVIAFEQGEAVTVHRIVQVYTEGDNRLYQTKGDANNIIDKVLVQKTQVKGKVIASSTVMGHAIYWLQHNFIIFILVVGLLLVVLIIRRLI